jgi:GT2 family glycosyltransferase
VVDLGSRDGSVDAEDAFPAAQFIKLPKNFGKTKALNLGIRATQANTVLLMSEPFVMTAADVIAMADRMDADASIGGLAPLVDMPQAGALPTPSIPDPPVRNGTPGESVEYVTGPLMLRQFLLTSLQKIDERYGDYGSAPELCMQVKRAGKRVVIDEARATRVGDGQRETSLTEADRQLGIAAYLGKHHGFVTGVVSHLKFLLGALFTLNLGRFRYLVTGQKVDGKQ